MVHLLSTSIVFQLFCKAAHGKDIFILRKGVFGLFADHPPTPVRNSKHLAIPLPLRNIKVVPSFNLLFIT